MKITITGRYNEERRLWRYSCTKEDDTIIATMSGWRATFSEVVDIDIFNIPETRYLSALQKHLRVNYANKEISKSDLSDIVVTVSKEILQSMNLCNIREKARVLAQAHRTKTGGLFFVHLPAEILIKIVGFTGNPEAHDQDTSGKIASQYFCKPSMTR